MSKYFLDNVNTGNISQFQVSTSILSHQEPPLLWLIFFPCTFCHRWLPHTVPPNYLLRKTSMFHCDHKRHVIRTVPRHAATKKEHPINFIAVLAIFHNSFVRKPTVVHAVSFPRTDAVVMLFTLFVVILPWERGFIVLGSSPVGEVSVSSPN